MQNLSDEELDDRMKQAGEFQDYAYDEASWQNVKARLDSPADSAAWITPVRIFSVVAVLSIMLLGIWVYTTSNKIKVEVTSGKNTDNGKSQLLTYKQPETISAATADLISFEKTEVISELENADFPNEDTHKNTSATRENSVISASVAHQEKVKKALVQTEFSIGADTKNTSKNTDLILHSSKQPLKQTISDNRISSHEPIALVVLNDSINETPAMSKEAIEQDSLVADTEADDKKQVRTGLWSVKLSLSPDWSAQSFSTTAALGFNYGLSLEYKLTNALGISAGILRTRKYYTAEDITYGRYTAEYAEGECNMWDIPIQLNYYVPTSRSIQVFGSVGLSSYLMSKENYTYYPYADNKTIRYSSAVENRNKEWFKVLNLSVGLQRPLGKALFVQVEPFVKVPLSEMGEGNIAISSLGLFLNLKYQLK